MTCSISLGPNNDLELTSPSGRRVYIPIGPHSTQLLWQCLWNSTAERRGKVAGIVGDFPTQAIVESWSKMLGDEKKEREAVRRAENFVDKFGFDLRDLDIDL